MQDELKYEEVLDEFKKGFDFFFPKSHERQKKKVDDVKVVVPGKKQNLFDTFKETTDFKLKQNTEFIGFSGYKV